MCFVSCMICEGIWGVEPPILGCGDDQTLATVIVYVLFDRFMSLLIFAVLWQIEIIFKVTIIPWLYSEYTVIAIHSPIHFSAKHTALLADNRVLISLRFIWIYILNLMMCLHPRYI